jgi:hypothetical protein
VLVHATQYLRYTHFPIQLNEIQPEVNNSMQSAFRCFGLHSTLQADLGIPPLVYYQMKQLPSSHFWLTRIHTNFHPRQILSLQDLQSSKSPPQRSRNPIHTKLSNYLRRLGPGGPIPSSRILKTNNAQESGEVLQQNSP